MQGFHKDTNLTKIVCWANALFIIPYLLSAFYFILKIFTDSVFREYHGAPALFFFITYTLFIAFYVTLLFGLCRANYWSRWLILVDSIAGFLLIYSFGFVGAYVLGAHPGQYVYLILMKVGERFNNKDILWYIFFLKASANTFNIFFFFGNPIFNLAKKYRMAHMLWIIPSAILIGLPAHSTYRMVKYTKKHISSVAEEIARREFEKIDCKKVRENNGKEIKYKVDEYEVSVTYDYDFTGVWVTAPDGRRGNEGGPKYFCRPDYKGPLKK